MLENKFEASEREADGERAFVVLSPFSPRPSPSLHLQVRADLESQLRSRRWAPGDVLPGEGDLCRHYGVSRGTLRRALDDLVREGLVERYPGRGSFIRRPKLEGHVAGSYRQFRIEGPPLDPGGVILSLTRGPLPSGVCSICGLDRDSQVYRLRRLRFAQGVPVTVQSDFIPAALCPGLTRGELSTRHLNDVLQERYGIEFTHADEFIEPGLADASAARHLTIATGTPVFLLERRSYLRDSRVGEFRQAVMRGDIYRYKIELR